MGINHIEFTGTVVGYPVVKKKNETTKIRLLAKRGTSDQKEIIADFYCFGDTARDAAEMCLPGRVVHVNGSIDNFRLAPRVNKESIGRVFLTLVAREIEILNNYTMKPNEAMAKMELARELQEYIGVEDVFKEMTEEAKQESEERKKK